MRCLHDYNVFSWQKHAAHAIIFWKKTLRKFAWSQILMQIYWLLERCFVQVFLDPRAATSVCNWMRRGEWKTSREWSIYLFFLFHASKDSRKKDGKRQQQSRRDHHLTVWCWCDFPQGSGSFSLSVSMPENLGHVQRFARIIIVYYAKIKRMCRPQNLVYVVLFYMEKVRGVVHSIVVYSNMAGVAWSTQNYY